jgi:hypothetical protein
MMLVRNVNKRVADRNGSKLGSLKLLPGARVAVRYELVIDVTAVHSGLCFMLRVKEDTPTSASQATAGAIIACQFLSYKM